MRPLIPWAALTIGALVAIGLFALILKSPGGFKAAGPVGSIQAVTLTNGQIYFGTLKSESPSELVLTDVFDVQVNIDQQSNQRTTRLNQRRLSTVHGPLDIAIPSDKILFTESVGQGSAAANAIANMEAAATAGTPTTNLPDAKK